MTDLMFRRVSAHRYLGLMEKVYKMCKEYDISLSLYPEHEDDNGSSHNTGGNLSIKQYGKFAQPLNLQTVITSLHEIGHLLDSMNFKDNNAYLKFYSVGGAELQAWKHAFDLAVEWGFTLDELNYMYTTAIDSSASYFCSETGRDDNDWAHMLLNYTGKLYNWSEYQHDLHNHFVACSEVIL